MCFPSQDDFPNSDQPVRMQSESPTSNNRLSSIDWSGSQQARQAMRVFARRCEFRRAVRKLEGLGTGGESLSASLLRLLASKPSAPVASAGLTGAYSYAARHPSTSKTFALTTPGCYPRCTSSIAVSVFACSIENRKNRHS